MDFGARWNHLLLNGRARGFDAGGHHWQLGRRALSGTLNTVMQSLKGNSGYNVNSAANRVDDSSDQVWTGTGGNGTATMLLTIAGYASYSSFGIYNLSDPSQKINFWWRHFSLLNCEHNCSCR